MKKKNNSNRVFGLFFSVFFLLLSSYFFFLKGKINYLFLFMAIIFLLLVLTNSKILTPLNQIWIHFGLFLGKITTPILMAIIYLFIFIPTSFFIKILNKNYINIKQDAKLDTYWEKNDIFYKNMNDQF